MRCAKNYEIAVGQLANLMDVERTDSVLMLFAVIEVAIRDIAGVNPPFEFDTEDFTFNLVEARAFLLGHRGGLYFDALGMDRDEAKRIIEKWLEPELEAIARMAESPQEMPNLTERTAARVVSMLAAQDRPMWIEDICREIKIGRENAVASLRLLTNRGRVTVTKIRCPGGAKHMYQLAPIGVAA